MSDGSDDMDNTGTDNREPGGKDKKDKESDFDRDERKGPVAPVHEDLFNFLSSLFTGEGEFPERVDCRTVKGRNRDQYGMLLTQYVAKSNTEKPSRERIVKLCNNFIHRMKLQTDVAQRETHFIIGAMHHSRSDDYYDIMPFTVMPSKKWRNAVGGTATGIQGNESGDEEDESFAGKYNLAMLGHHTNLFGLVGGMIEGLIDRSDRQAAAAMNDAEKMRARYIELLEANLKIMQAKDERDEKLAEAKMWREQKQKGMELAWQTIPPLLTSFKPPNANVSWTPGTESNEAITIREALKSQGEGGKCSQADFEIICGKLDENGMLTTRGILTPEQVQLLVMVANKEANPDALDELLDGGSLAITPEQAALLVQSGAVAVLMPLKILMEQQLAKRAARQANKPNGEK